LARYWGLSSADASGFGCAGTGLALLSDIFGTADADFWMTAGLISSGTIGDPAVGVGLLVLGTVFAVLADLPKTPSGFTAAAFAAG
jgi:hypothetical protein